MVAKLQDQKRSRLDPFQFSNIFFEYLPVGEAANGTPLNVCTIYFATDEPLKTARNNGKAAFAEILKDPGKFLTDDDKEALENLLKPIDGGHGGSRTRDPVNAMPKPANAHAFAKAFAQVTNVTWFFVGRADPREPSKYNINLAAARARAVGGYLMKYIWDGYKTSRRPADYSTTIGKLLEAYGRPSYSVQDWTNDYFDPIPTKHQWRATLAYNIFEYLASHSLVVGDDGRDPADVENAKYPELRRVNVMVNSIIGSAEHDWTTDCSVFDKKAEWYNASKNDELPPVIEPDFLYDFNPNTQQSGQWNVRKQFRSEIGDAAGSYSYDEIGEKRFAEILDQIMYGYRWVRMAQHELFRGHVPPDGAGGPGWTNPGTDPAARKALCRSGFGTLRSQYEDMIPSDLGHYIFGGNIIDNTSGIKPARQIAHQFWVRNDPWYRVAFMKEIPGTMPSDSWDLDGKANPPEEVALWPTAEDIADLPKNVRRELNPKKWGKKSNVTPPGNPTWKNGIPKALGRDSEGGPVGYMSGAEHYVYLASEGYYTYDGLGYMDEGLNLIKLNKREQLAREYEKRNHNPGTQPYTRNIREAVKEAQEMIKDELGDHMYGIYLKKERNPYPDYTNSTEWNRWKDPMNDPYTKS